MIQFYTDEFLEELARRLGEDKEWMAQAKTRPLRIICSAHDLKRSFLIAVEGDRVHTEPASPSTPARFRFEGPYDAWVRLCKGETEFEKLVETGTIRVTGPMPELMSMFGVLNRIVLAARSFPKEF